MEKFKIPVGVSLDRAFEIIATECNILRDRLEKLEARPKAPSRNIVNCTCDSDYTGTHRQYCQLYGQRV
jgi:hypothetical protein